MTNKQLAVARKVANQFPDAEMNPVAGGISVNGETVEIGANMTPAQVEQALRAALDA
jgi:hypothetical protein